MRQVWSLLSVSFAAIINYVFIPFLTVQIYIHILIGRQLLPNLCFYFLDLLDNEGQIPPSAESRDIFGILGIINLLAGEFELFDVFS